MRVSDGVLDVVVICRRSATKNALLESRDYSIVLAGESIKKGPKESGKMKENIKGRVFSGKYFNLENFLTFV